MDERNLSKRIQRILRAKGFPLIGLRECKQTKDFSLFSKALGAAVDYNKYGPYVDKQSEETLKQDGARAFLSKDKKAGVAVWPDGNIGAVFKDKRSRNDHATAELLLTALSIGGNKLDCYDGFLSNLYAAFGFIPVARVAFDREFAPENWREDLGEPDVVFWLHCGDPVEVVAERTSNYHLYSRSEIGRLPLFANYEEAYRYRDAKQEEKP